MARWVRSALVFGVAGLVVSLALLAADSTSPNCSLSGGMVYEAFILEICLAAAAGFAAVYRAGSPAQPAMAGFGSAALTSLSGLVFMGLALMHVLPQPCYEDFNGLAVFLLLLVLVFGVPFEVLAGALAGWLGGRVARAVERAT